MKQVRHRHPLPTVRSRLLAMMAGCVLMPLIGAQLVMHFVTQRSLEKSSTEKYKTLVDQLANQTASLMTSAERNLRLLNTVLAGKRQGSLTGEVLKTEINRLVETGSAFDDISIFFANGNMVQAVPPDQVSDRIEKTTWFTRAAEGDEVVLSSPHLALEKEDLVVAVYVPLPRQTTGTGSKLVARGRASFGPVSRLLRDVKLGEDGYTVLLDELGNVLAHPDQARWMLPYDGPGGVAKTPVEHGTMRDAKGTEVLWIAQQIGPERTRVEESWTLLAVIPKRHVIAFASQSALIHLAGGLLTLLSVGGLGYWFANRITHPLTAAAQAATRLASGHTSTRMNEATGAVEIRQLAIAFNQMVREVGQHRGGLERVVAERTRDLQQQQERAATLSAQLRAAFQATEEAVLILRSDGHVLGANRQFGRFFGVNAEQLGGTFFSQWREAFFACFADAAGFSRRWDHGLTHDTRSSAPTWEVAIPLRRMLDVYAAPLSAENGDVLGQLWVFRDLSHELELQESLEQAQKMEAIGRLAGGVAHDFNNLLTGIIGNLSLAEAPLTAPGLEESRYHVHHARTAAERAAQLVKGLLGFSRRSHLELAHCHLNEVIRDFHPLIQRVIDPRTTMRIELAEGLWGIHADVRKLEQVIMNLCVNARDAIAGTGVITIQTRNENVPQDVARRHQGGTGDHICLTVSDDGSGIDPEVIDKIFEPFFTTKETGKGTGLGLATSYGIVQQHGGWMECESTPGVGTSFHVFLPRNDNATEIEAQPVAIATSVRGDELLLLVDDEQVVRIVAETVLKGHGYRIMTAADGQEAIDAFRTHGNEISLVLMDMTMPRMSGLEAFRAMRAIDPWVPVVICSGYIVDLCEFETPEGDRPNGFVQKPYHLQDLLTTVRATIDAAGPRPKRPPGPAAARRPALAT